MHYVDVPGSQWDALQYAREHTDDNRFDVVLNEQLEEFGELAACHSAA
jgi:hypothetical protein